MLFSQILSCYILQLNGTPVLLQYLLALFEETVVLMLSRMAVVSRLRLAAAVATISGAVASGQPAFQNVDLQELGKMSRNAGNFSRLKCKRK